MLGLGQPVRSLPQSFTGSIPADVCEVRPFCPGCLVVVVNATPRIPNKVNI